MFAQSRGLFWPCCAGRFLVPLTGVLLGDVDCVEELAWVLGLSFLRVNFDSEFGLLDRSS
jgi:hypothetical protein